MKRLVFLLASAAVFSACNSGSNSALPSNVPSGLNDGVYQKIVSGTSLSPLSTQIQLDFFKKSAAEVPGMNLILDKYSDSNRRATDLAKLNDHGKALLGRIKQNCTIAPGETATTGS